MDVRVRQSLLTIIADLVHLLEPQDRAASDVLVLLCAKLVGFSAQLLADVDAARAEVADAWAQGYEAGQAAHAAPVASDAALRLCHGCARSLGEL